MFLLFICLLDVVPWCVQCDFGVFRLGGIFRHRDYAAFATPLPPVNFWYFSVGASSPPSMLEACPCGSFDRLIDLCLALVWTA